MTALRTLSTRLLLFLCVTLSLCGVARPQEDTGSIAGTVKDTSGALVAGAKVMVSDIDREFRWEFFNVFNDPNLQFAKSGPQDSINTTTFGTPEFGLLTAARDPRQIQLALKLSF